MTPEEYRREIRRARQAALALDVETARQVQRAVQRYAARLEREIRQRAARGVLPSSRRQQTLEAALQAAEELAARLEEITRSSIQLSANQVAEIADRATRQYVVEGARANLADADAEALIGFFTDGGNLRGASAYAARISSGEAPVASRFATLLRGHVENAAEEVDRILLQGITERTDPTRLARRLRGYVTGAEQFEDHLIVERDSSGEVTARKIDLRTIPKEQRGAARKVAFRAERIAITESHVASHEATVHAMREAPQVEGVRWNLSADRGSTAVPDECDYLAQADWYGLGPGVYPVDRVPPTPHPFDRCFTTPELREFDEWRRDKPSGSLDESGIESAVGGGTETRRQRAVENARNVVTSFEREVPA